ncbi:MAG: arginase [Eubacteriales bacterium]
MKNKRGTIALIGVSMDLGASKEGASLGPEAVRVAGITERLEKIGYKVNDLDNIAAKKKDAVTVEGSNLKNLNEILRVNKELCQTVEDAMKRNEFPVVIGGDHSIAMGSIFGALQTVPKLGVIWFDAHGDINTPEISPSGNIHGMPVSVLIGEKIGELETIGNGRFLDRTKIVYIGARDLDKGERKRMKSQGIATFTMHEIDDLGIKEVMDRAIKIAGEGTDGIHVSFDMDAMDPEIAPGTGTKVPGGMKYRETHYAMEIIAMSGKLVSAEFVEVNPLLDHENKTAEAAVALAGSLLGEWLI